MAEYLADLVLGFDNLSRRGLFEKPWRWTGTAPDQDAAEAMARRAARLAHPSLTLIVRLNVILKVAIAGPPGDH